jgi:putative protease
MELEEDEKGTYLFNSYDINLIDQLDKLWEAGVESFKIEGRSKSVYYVAVATRAYRKVLDGLVQVKAGELPPSAYGELIEEQKQELEKLSHRGYWTGFLLGQQPPHLTEQDAVRSVWEFVGIAESADPERSDSKSGTQAKLKKIDKKWREVFVHNALRVGDAVEVVTPQGNQQVRVEQIRNDKGEKVASAHGGQNEIFSVEFSQVVKEGVFLLRKKIG